MTDPYYKEMKHQKREYDWVSNCDYANYKIPTKCICGGAITVETGERGRNYYVCKDFKVILEFKIGKFVSIVDGNGFF
ncbi:hypothetical protein Bca101_009644 [Brassica carinata]